MSVGNWDLQNLAVFFLGAPLIPGGESGALKIEKEDPTFKHTKGVGGDVARWRTGSSMYKISLTVLQTSKVNAVLTVIQQLDERSANGSGIGPFAATDLGGSSIFVAGSAWLEGPPTEQEYTNTAKDRVWIIMANADLVTVGGN